jgi:ferredoxin-thioredoxin reductase catalytic chain
MAYTKEEKEILDSVAEYAKKHGYLLNPEDKKLQNVIKGLAKNMQRFGKQYCPCRIRSGDTEKDKQIVCPCIFHEKEIEDQGSCHCNLYFQKEK